MKTIYIVIFVVVTLVSGGSATVAGIKFEWPLITNLKSFLFTDKEVLDRFAKYKSYHAVTMVLSVKNGDKTEEPTITSVSNQANEFYGKAIFSEELIGETASELFKILKPWMVNYEEFEMDQYDVMDAYKKGEDAYAKAPIIFNNNHPKPQYKGKTFIPIIVGLTGEKKEGEKEIEYLTVLYFDYEKLPKIDRDAKR